MYVHDRASDCLGNMDAKITLHFQVKIKLLFKKLFKKCWTVCWHVQNKLCENYIHFEVFSWTEVSAQILKCSEISEKNFFCQSGFSTECLSAVNKTGIFGKVLFQAEQL